MTTNTTNPFDHTDTDYLVLVNHEEQHSLWPTHIAVPHGWTTVHGPSRRQTCTEYVERNWNDITPKSRRLPSRSGNAERRTRHQYAGEAV